MHTYKKIFLYAYLHNRKPNIFVVHAWDQKKISLICHRISNEDNNLWNVNCLNISALLSKFIKLEPV